MNENIEVAAQMPSEPDPHGREAVEAFRVKMQARAELRERARITLLPILNQLSNELALFLARAEGSGFSPAMREQWGKVFSLGMDARLVVREFQPLSTAQQATWDSTGVVMDRATALVPGFRLLDETLNDLTFAVLQNEAGAWLERFPLEKLKSIGAILRVVNAQRTSLESGPMIEGCEWPDPPAFTEADRKLAVPMRERLDDTERGIRDALRRARQRDEGLKALTLAHECSVSEDAVNRAVKRLRKKGYSITQGRGASGYRLLDEPSDG